jgi:DNA topoisomerase IA
VLASFGHIRDLPSKDGSVKPDDDFSMVWEVDARAQVKMKDIASAMKGADKLILATDPDREGEAISWHILEVLKEKKLLKTGRAVAFNAVTNGGAEAMKHPRQSTGTGGRFSPRRALDLCLASPVARLVAQTPAPAQPGTRAERARLVVGAAESKPSAGILSIDTDLAHLAA